MNEVEANNKAKQVFEEWKKECEEIKINAKKNGMWNSQGLDSNNHLFKEANQKAKDRLEAIKPAKRSQA